ncbi:hypothetical protein FIBSPDRAFT_1037064 [Athelia psychrophila]|uniref:Uncharacterized protein n=1 Tax=Athelia psychrophila TaxID=1759441 RepID=A0A166UP38_9AGAM|nr:hypothetical protein FIBSPDRAFT_1037064 [Fibularhizoctonia sp. CBS 109695]
MSRTPVIPAATPGITGEGWSGQAPAISAVILINPCWIVEGGGNPLFPGNFGRDPVSQVLAALGLSLAVITGVACLVGGFYANTHTTQNSSPAPPTYNIGWSIKDHSIEREIVTLTITIVVAICTEAVGFVHSVSLRSTLATEGRLEFTTNLRLFTAANWNFGNSKIMNTLMAVLLVVLYAASSMILPRYKYEYKDGELQHAPNDSDQPTLSIWPIPLIVLGAALLLQVIIAIIGVLTSPHGIQTWSASQFDVTAAAIRHVPTPINYRPNRCMLSVRERGDNSLSLIPRTKQPSPWKSHPRVQKVVWFTLMFVPAYIIGGATVVQLTKPTMYKNLSWSFLPNDATFTHPFNLGPSIIDVLLTFIVVVAAQSPLTMGLHGCEIITNIVRDEKAWRRASRTSGAPISSSLLTTIKDLAHNPGAGLSAWWPNICLLIVKPASHWTFGLAFHSSGVVMEVGPVQFFYLALMMGLFTAIMMLLAFRSPIGPQPAAYGHLQTLADLIDYWPHKDGRIFWGDKSPPRDNSVYHAGTSDTKLPPVKMGVFYAGEDSLI